MCPCLALFAVFVFVHECSVLKMYSVDLHQACHNFISRIRQSGIDGTSFIVLIYVGKSNMAAIDRCVVITVKHEVCPW